LRANPALARMNGFASEAEQLAAQCDIAGRWYVDPQRRAEFMREMALHGQVVGFESEVFRYKTRERIWVSENAHRVCDAQGRPMFYEGTVEDITDRVNDREALRVNQQQMQQLIELMPGMVYRVLVLPDGHRKATFISGGSRALFGVEPADMLADGMLMHKLRHPDDRARIEVETSAANAESAALRTEYRVLLPSGEVKWVQVFSAPAPSVDGVPARVGVVVDITALKQAEMLRLERDGAAAADRAKSAFLSRVSHELRTPLNAVLGFVQLMEMDPGHGEFSQRQLSWTRQALASGRHLTALMDDLLDLSSAQTGQLRFNLTAVGLQPLVAEACAMLAGEAATAGVQIRVAPLPDAALALRADRKRLLQVLGNLLSNAIKYNRRGGWVEVQAEPAPGGEREAVELRVADSGPGLDDSQRGRLFQPFERLNAHAGPVAGTGLGLALSRQLVEAMGGTLWVDSEPGQGAVFSLRLPRATQTP
jgi:PAS domain S-box-containing protein